MRNKKKLYGVIPAIVTPFKENNINEEVYRELIENLIGIGVTGIVPIGTTGEFIYMKREEKIKAIEIAVDQVNNRIPVIAGTGANSIKETIELTKIAKDLGADAALIVTSYYLKLTDKEVYEFYKSIAEKVDIPIILYNIPQCTGFEIKWWIVEGLAEIENIIGIKDSSGNMKLINSLLEKVKDKISIICGHDEIAATALMAGADGVILASANVIPDKWLELYRAIQSKNLDKARQIQREIQKITRLIVKGGAVAVKEALHMMGYKIGETRKPMIAGDFFTFADIEELRITLEDLGKINKKPVEFIIDKERKIITHIPAIPETPEKIVGLTFKAGEGFAGPPIFEIAHIDLVLGLRNGPLGSIIKEIFEKYSIGHKPKIITEKPLTILVPIVRVRNEKQAKLVYEVAAEGVRRAVNKSIEDGFIPKQIVDEMVIIANVFVHPAASNCRRILMNNFKAMRYAIRKAIEGRPKIRELQKYREIFRHPFRYQP